MAATPSDADRRAAGRKDEDGRTPLHWSCARGELQQARDLLALNDSVVNQRDEVGWTPLMSASSAGHVEVMELLLANGADANVGNDNQQIPLHYHKGREGVASLLIKSTAKINRRDKYGSSALSRAASCGQMAVVEQLLAAGANIDIRDKEGNTPLHLACESGHEQLALYLAQTGADKTMLNKAGKLAADVHPVSVR